MEIVERSHGDWKVLQLSGRIDNNGAIIFKDRLLPLTAMNHGQVLLDFSTVHYLSSAGLRVLLIGAQQSQAAHGKLRVCHVSPPMHDFFKMSGLDKVLKIYSTLAEAVR